MAQHKIKLDIASGIDRKTGQYQIPYLQLKYMPLTIGGRRPVPDRRGRYPISIVKATFDPVYCPVFGEQFDIITESQRPYAALRDFNLHLSGC